MKNNQIEEMLAKCKCAYCECDLMDCYALGYCQKLAGEA